METNPNSCQSILILSDRDDADLSLVEPLQAEGYRIHVRPKAFESLQAQGQKTPNLLLVDTDILSMDELSHCRKLRTIYPGPLLLMANRVDEMLQVLALEMGVDDIVVKPVNTILLLARIRALLRRPPSNLVPREMRFGDLEIHGDLRQVRCRGVEVPLTSREFDLLWFLAKNARTAVSRDQLFQEVFGIEYNGQDRSIDMYVSRLRHKLEDLPGQPRLLKTVRGVGYLLAATD